MTEVMKVYNTEDTRNSKGLWVKSHTPVPFVKYITRSALVWQGIQYRCKSGGKWSENRPTYVGCVNRFSGYQEFTEWCQGQYGYLSKDENGVFWALDKDIISSGSLTYSEDTCIFVPQSINNLMTYKKASVDGYPVGVGWHSRDKIFEASCRENGKLVYLGRYQDYMDGHFAWGRYKVEAILRASEDPCLRNHTKLVEALRVKASYIQECLDTGIEILF